MIVYNGEGYSILGGSFLKPMTKREKESRMRFLQRESVGSAEKGFSSLFANYPMTINDERKF